MDSICKFNELLQSKNVYSYTETNTISQYNERPGWKVDLLILINKKKFSATGNASTKKDAKRKACTKIVSDCEAFNIEELLIIGNVEQHPGPPCEVTEKFTRFVFPLNVVTFFPSEEDITVFQIDGIKYTIPSVNTSVGNGNMEVKFFNRREADDFNNCITRLGIRNLNATGNIPVKVRSYASQSNVRITFSNHRNFDPFLRMMSKMSSAVLEVFSGETEGRIVVDGSLTFAPKNILRVNFKNVWYKGISVPCSLYNQVLNSVKKQTMTREQLYTMAAQLASLRMYNLTPADFQSAAGIFWRLYILNIDLLNKNRKIEVNYDDSWTFIKTQPIIIPTDVFHYGSTHEIFTANYPSAPIPSFDKMLDNVKIIKDDFAKMTRTQILDSFSSGLMDLLADEIREFRFDYSHDSVPRNMSNKELELSEQEKFMHTFIFEQIFEPDVALCIRNAISKHPDLFDHVISKISAFSFAGLWHDTLSERFRELVPVEVDEFERTDLINHIVTKRSEYKRFAQRCQLVAQVWAKVLHFEPLQQVFNSTAFVKEVAARKIPSAEKTMGLFSAFSEAKTTFVNALNAGKESTSFWNENKERLSSLMAKIEAPFAPALVNSDFSSFSNSLASCKQIVNQLFYAAVEKIATLFGIEYESPRIDVTTFLFYYLVWKDTSSIGIKTMIIVEVLTALGIIDKFTEYIGRLWEMIKKLGNKIVQYTCDGVDDETFDIIINSINDHTATQNEKAAKMFQATDNDEPAPIDNIPFIEKVMGYLEKGTPCFLGIAATLLLSSFACSGPLVNLEKCDFLKYGKEIIASARNLSFLGAGLAAIPKVYVNFVAAFKWVVDQVKSLVCSQHSTTYQVNSRAEKWIKDTALFSGAIGYAFTTSPETCLNYISLYAEMNELKKEQLRFHKEISFAFNARVKIFEPFFERVRSIMYCNFNLQEMFHVQIYGAPGVGKTDLADALLVSLKDAYATSRIDFGVVTGGSAPHVMHLLEQTKTGFGDVYNMNETLKHLDGYQGQNFIRVDDCNIFQNPEPDAITTSMLMLSGTATLANKADLNDKGMVITARGMVSATNNPFIKPDKMIDPQALWRRRILLHVQPHPDFCDRDGNMLTGEALNKKFAEKGWDRSKSEHILVTPLDPINPAKKPLRNDLVGMNLRQTVQYINAMAKQHYAVEWNRSFTKDPYGAAIRMRFEEVMSTLLGGGSTPQSKAEFNCTIKKMVDKICETRKKMAEDLKTRNPNVKIQNEDIWGDKVKAAFEQDLQNSADYILCENECDALREIGSLPQLVELIGKEDTNLPDFLTTNSAGEVERVESFHSFKFDVHDVGLDHIVYSKTASKFVCNVPADDSRYEDKNFSMRVNQNLAYVNSLCKFSADAYLAKHNKKKNAETMSIIQKIKVELEYAAAITLRACGQTFKLIMSTVVDYIGRPIMMGACVTIGLVGLFFSCSMIGQMLAPQPTSYTQSSRPLQIFGVGTQKTFLDEQEMPAHFLSNAQSLEKNSFIVNIEGTVITFRAVGIQGNIFMINYHSAELISKNLTANIFDPKTGITVRQPLSPKDWRRVTKNSGGLVTDAALIKFSMVRTPRSIVQRFMTEHDVQNKMVNLRTSSAIPVIYRKDAFLNKERCPILAVESNLKLIEHERIVAIPIHVEQGESGSLFTHDNTMLEGHILGLLSARNTISGMAFVGVVTQEELRDTLKSFEHRDKIIVTHVETQKLDPEHTLATVFKHGQTAKVSHLPSQSISHSLGYKPTPLFGLFPCEAVPAIQSDDDPRWNRRRHYLEVSLNKSSGAHYADFNNNEESFMMSLYEATLYTATDNLHCVRIFTTQQSIMGVREPGSTSIDLKNCSGLEYKLERGVSGKSPFITVDARGTYNIQQRVFQEVARYENAYIEGIVPRNFKLEFRKKELVGPNKIEEPKTRTVGMGNFIHQIVFMKIYKDLHTQLKTVWARGGSMHFALGVDPEQHWDQVATHLRYHDYMIDMDVKAWEEKINQRLLFMCDQVELKVIRAAYASRGEYFPPETEKIAYGLSADYTQCDVAIEDILYEKFAGLLSGHPGTFMRNSAVHTMIIGLAVRRILLRTRPEYATIPFILEHVRFILAADDVVIAISPLARKYVTVERLVAAYNEIGFAVTAADKGANIRAKNILEIQFLKHTFVSDGLGGYKCCPNLSIVHQLVNWYRTDSSQTKEKQIADNLNTALRFVWHRGESEYEHVRSTINMACKKIKMNYVSTLDYDEMGNLMRLHKLIREQNILNLDPQTEEPDLDYVIM